MSNVSTQFKKGQSGNPKGAPKRDWTWAGVLEKAVQKKIKDKKSGKFVELKEIVAQGLITAAARGDIRAHKVLMDRMDGMPELKGQIDSNVTISIDKDLEQKDE